MVKAVWQGQVLAESEATVEVEGNHYFPPESIKQDLMRNSSKRTTCGWKGIASYYDVVVGDQINQDAAWYYPEPKSAAENIKDYIAFWKGVEIVE